MKYFIYARKSTDDEERQILSIQAQLDELRMLATKEGLQVVREYIEAQTAKEPGRPVFNEMLAAMEKGEAQGILAWHPDRLARNSVDGGRIVYALDTGKVSALKFPTFWFENTPQGKFMLSIAFGQSKYYVDNLSENIRRGLRKKLREGIYPNMPPPGYRNDKQTRAIVIDEARALFIRKMFEAYATGVGFVVDFNEGVEAEVVGEGEEVAELGIVEDADDEEHGVGAHGGSFVNLVGGDDEVFAKDGEGGCGAGLLEVGGGAFEEGGFGEDGEGSRAAGGVGAGEGGGGEVGGDVAEGGGGAFDFGDDADAGGVEGGGEVAEVGAPGGEGFEGSEGGVGFGGGDFGAFGG
ncbi:MAG: hypothetical protein BWX54_00910 [Verrucomicrobia bacterium ADurb.Bin018]|nr:MAG: hypothetical protein BWX54_00910 [Verrucomicrobia bacterium ADurb.Bin018]